MTDITDQQALEVIERICGDDFCEDMDIQAALLVPPPEWSPELRIAMEKLWTIWRIAHSIVKSHSCFGVHQDWREEAGTMYRAICTDDTASTPASTEMAESPEPKEVKPENLP